MEAGALLGVLNLWSWCPLTRCSARQVGKMNFGALNQTLLHHQMEVLSKQDVLATPAPTACVTSFTYTGSARIWNSVCVNTRCDCNAGRLDLAHDSFREAFVGLLGKHVRTGQTRPGVDVWDAGRGYCWDGQRCSMNAGAVGASRVNALPESFAALLVLYIVSHLF